jgi:hypothetical protein
MKRFVHAAALVSSCLALVGCPDDSGSGGGGGAPPVEPGWQVVFDDGELDRSLLSIWGTSKTSVFAAGGPLRNSGREALALHFDGSTWKDLDAGGADTFWWVHGTSDDDVWFVGEKGRITHYDGSTFTEHDSGTTATLWGAIAFAPDDVWVVGGTVGGPDTTPDDIVLHYDGTAFSPITLPGEPLGRALFKVWGTSADDLFVVGEAGAIWHKSGDEWVLQSDPPVATGNLTTVHGCSSTDVWAVGGRDLLHYDGTTWTKLDKGLGNDVNGVFCIPAGDVGIAGMGGLKQRRVDGEWIDEFGKDPHGDLHAIWADEEGGFWVAGGDFISSPKPDQPRNGIIARYGDELIPDTLE